jgi:lysyl-tRNA synthetase class 2
MVIRNAALAISRLVGFAAAAVLLSSMSIGWLYLLEAPTAHWPGPRLADALPLDELSGRAGISLIVFIVAMAAAALFTAAIGRLLGFDGFAAALTIGFVIGAWLYIASAISIFVVRQISLDQAFDATRDLPPVYAAAVLFALALALTAPRRTGEQWLTRLVPASTGLLGVITLLSATLPHSANEQRVFGGLFTAPTAPLARTIEITIGIVLLLCARGLGRASRRALGTATTVIAISLIVRIVNSFDLAGVLVCAFVLLSLLTRRGDFSSSGDPTTRLSSGLRAGGLALCGFLYGVGALIVNRLATGLPVHLLVVFRVTLRSLVIGSPLETTLIPGGFSEWFPWSLRVIFGLAVAWGVATWFAPWRQRIAGQAGSHRRARQLVQIWGGDTLAPFALRRDKAYFLFPDGPEMEATTLISYRVLRGIAIVSGDPIGPDDEASLAIAAFRSLCAARGWRFALIGASERFLGVYRSLGLHVLYHGDEAIVDIPTFSLAGGGLKSVRQAVHRVARNGYQADVHTAAELSSEVRDELSALERSWLDGDPRKGFVMEFAELFGLDGDDVLFVTARGPSRELAGFLELAVCRASRSLSLSSMPRGESAPNGLNAFLIVRGLEWGAAHGYEMLSLNFSPAARLLDRGPQRGWRRLARAALLIVKRLLNLQLDNLLLFNRHFAPRWQSRYVVIERFRHLPRVIVAAMAVEGYLPLGGLVRGRERRDGVEYNKEARSDGAFQAAGQAGTPPD